MDQLHEELKQPQINENEEKEEEPNIHEPHPSPTIGQSTSERPVSSMETSSTSSQSDCDYETCDSALGSERGSTEINNSSDENSDVNEFAKLNLSANSREMRSQRRHLRNSFGTDVTEISEEGVSLNSNKLSAKEQKDSINSSKKAVDNISVCSDDQRSDSGEFMDAESEPLRPRRQNSFKKSGSKGTDTSTQHSKHKLGSYPSSSGKIKKNFFVYFE